MNRKRRSQEELREESDGLWFMVGFFQSLANSMASAIAGTNPTPKSVPLFFLLRAKNLINFFYAEKPNQDPVIAADFFKNSEEWEKARPPKSEILKRAEIRADKESRAFEEAADLSYLRENVTPKTKLWEYVEISAAITEVIDKFIEVIPNDLKTERWDKRRPDEATRALDQRRR